MRGDEAAITQCSESAAMFSYEDALAAVLDAVSQIGVELINIVDCAGRVLAEDIHAGADSP